MVRVRFAPSPTGSLHVGNALTAHANRRLGDWLLLRIDDTDAARNVEGGEEAIVRDLEWLGIAWEEGPVRQSERGDAYRAAAERVEGVRVDGSGATVWRQTTLLRPDGSATYQLASVVDDLEFRITHVLRGSEHRANDALQAGLARALGAEPPEYLHHGLILGPDGRKLSKRDPLSSIAGLREAGIPAEAVRAYLEELGSPRHDVRFDETRLRRLATDALAALSDEELAARVGAPARVGRALRGARDLVEAGRLARAILEPAPVSLPGASAPTLGRFAELRDAFPDVLGEDDARALVRELKAVGGDLKVLRLALTGAPSGPELWAVVAALPRADALARIARVSLLA